MIPRTKSESLISRRNALSVLPVAALSAAPLQQGGSRQHLNPPTVSTPRGYSHAVVVTGGKTIYLSGQISVDRTGKLVGEGNLKAQAQQVFENLKAVLEAAGATFENVVKFGIYMLDASQVQVVRDVRDTFINAQAPPASTLVEVRRLAREGLLIEIEAIVHLA